MRRLQPSVVIEVSIGHIDVLLIRKKQISQHLWLSCQWQKTKCGLLTFFRSSEYS